jgi:hypothetical protein
MFKITVKGKEHIIETVTPRALYEMGPALEMFAKIGKATAAAEKGEPVQDDTDLKKAMEVLLDWFVVFCGKKFTREDLLDGYPADSIIADVALALRAVQSGVTSALKEFPTTARRQGKKAAEGAETPAPAASRCRSTLTAWKKAFRRKS